MKRPVGRPRKRRLEDDTFSRQVLTAKSLRLTSICIYTKSVHQQAKAAHCSIRKAPWCTAHSKEIWHPSEEHSAVAEELCENDVDQGIAKITRGPKKHQILKGRQKAGRKLSYPIHVYTIMSFLAFIGKTPRVIKGLKAPPGFVLAFQKNAWMNAI